MSPTFSKSDLWVRRLSLAVLTALAVGLVLLGIALYGPTRPRPLPSTLTLQEFDR